MKWAKFLNIREFEELNALMCQLRLIDNVLLLFLFAVNETCESSTFHKIFKKAYLHSFYRLSQYKKFLQTQNRNYDNEHTGTNVKK
ncbi:hypothetical protein BpHYR1_036683 [Brachionus plicatilis]|uniref:Uncharacterized protein n=1 Tax=Brachionus plicatilis TaxID=10195 RepID=A0A3M7QK97_BRAPC|nr:hypothetical protein BpHYR1_036683 [Brachionus plicatilis]